MSEFECELQRQVDELKEKLIAEREAVEACEGCKLTGELRAEIAKRDKGIARLKRRRDELERALEIDSRIKASQDGAIEEIARQRDELQEEVEEMQDELKRVWKESTKWKARCAELQAERDALADELAECIKEPYMVIDLATQIKCDVEQLVADNRALKTEAAYWKREVELCMQSAYPPSHSPERGYNPNVMAYPDRHGCTTPSTLVSDVIDGLRDAAQDGFFKAKLGDVMELEKERDRWRAKAESIRDERREERVYWEKEVHAILDALNGKERFWGGCMEYPHDEHDMLPSEVANRMVDRLRGERDEWKALAKSYEENYVGPLREAGFDVHAKAVAAALEAVDRENDHLKNELARTSADCEKWRAKFGKALDSADEIRRLA